MNPGTSSRTITDQATNSQPPGKPASQDTFTWITEGECCRHGLTTMTNVLHGCGRCGYIARVAVGGRIKRTHNRQSDRCPWHARAAGQPTTYNESPMRLACQFMQMPPDDDERVSKCGRRVRDFQPGRYAGKCIMRVRAGRQRETRLRNVDKRARLPDKLARKACDTFKADRRHAPNPPASSTLARRGTQEPDAGKASSRESVCLNQRCLQ